MMTHLLYSGCAGINAKGANKVIIKDNIVERTAGFGIAVAIDPYW